MRHEGYRRKGMTIVEILVTLVIIGASFTPIIGMLSMSTHKIYWGGDETHATILASDILEVIRGAPYDAFFWKDEEVGMTLQDIFKKHPIPQTHDLDKYDSRFTIIADVTAAGDLPPSQLKRVKVIVTWKDKKTDKPRSIALVSFYGRPR